MNAGSLRTSNFQAWVTKDGPRAPTVVVFHNRTATSVTCTVSGATSCSDTTHAAVFAAGDLLSVNFTAAGTLDKPYSAAATWWATFH